MAAEMSIQSLDRGLQVLRLLSRTPVMTATAIACELGVHQSSASRLLGSLLKAGFVRKPDFHSFALDYGALAFAGHALNCFPEIRVCTRACNQLSAKHGFNAAVGILREGRVLYLTQVSGDATISILDDTGFPLHRSSLGLALACEKDETTARELLAASIRRLDAGAGITQDERVIEEQAEAIRRQTMENLDLHGYFYQTQSPQNAVNGAQTFLLNCERAAVAVYHPTQHATVGEMRAMLKEAVEQITGDLKRANAAP